MALPHMSEEEEDGDGEDNYAGSIVPADVQAVMAAAEEGDSASLIAALSNLTSGVDCEGEDGDRPLHIACLYGHQSCVQILLASGASVEARDEDGGLPLHDACAGGYKEIVSMLLRACSSQTQAQRLLDAFDVDGDTPLHHAARGNHADVVQQLLDFGASSKIQNGMGQTPADLADPGSDARTRLLEFVGTQNSIST